MIVAMEPQMCNPLALRKTEKRGCYKGPSTTLSCRLASVGMTNLSGIRLDSRRGPSTAVALLRLG